MLFGNAHYDELPDQVVEILVDAGLGAAQYEQLRRNDAIRNALQQRNMPGNKLYFILRKFGLPAAAVGALVRAWTWEEQSGRKEGIGKRKPTEQIGAKNKHHANDYNLKKPGEIPKAIEAEKAGEKRPAPPVIDKIPQAPKTPKNNNDFTPVRSWWEDHTLQDRDHNWLHSDEWEEDDVDEFEEETKDEESSDLGGLWRDEWDQQWNDIISEFAPDPRNDDEIMDESMEPVPETAAARAGTTGAGNVSKETPISPATPSYGLQETHTTICPFNGYFAVVNPDATMSTANTTYQSFRLTAPLDIVVNNLATVAAGANYPAAPGNIINVPFNNSATRSATNAATFPLTTPNGSSATEKAGWFAFWAKVYEYYTVLKVDYEFTIVNPSQSAGNGILVAMDFDSYSDTAGATGNITPKVATLHEMMAYKNIRWKRVGPNVAAETINRNNVVTIRGSYRPGQARRNISNDGDVKTWTKVDALPSLKEFLNIYFYRDPLSYIDTSTAVGVNISYKFFYTVQFKDLQQQARYPSASLTDISMTLDTDTVQKV